MTFNNSNNYLSSLLYSWNPGTDSQA